MKRLDLAEYNKITKRFFHKWSKYLLLTIIAILLLVILSDKVGILARGALFNTKPNPIPSPTVILTPSPTPTSSLTPTHKPSPTPVVIYKEPSPLPTNTPTQIPISTQDTKIDSATQIELCKTKAETFKTQTKTAMALVFNQQNPEIVELANASTLGEIKIVAIKYGKYKEGDFDSNPTLTENYFNYLHNWALQQVSNYMNTVNAKGDMAYNDYYSKCLSGENY